MTLRKKANSDTRIAVIIMDMLCMTPFYDRYLIEALSKKDPAIALGSISFHLDPGYFKRYGIKRLRIVDLVAKLRINNKPLRQALKLAEYVINLASLSAAMIFKRPGIIHVHWIPLITRTSLELWFLKLTQLLGVKIVYTVHNVLPHDTGFSYRDKFRNVYHTMDALICHTAQAKDELMRDFGISAEKIWVIPHGPLCHDVIMPSREDAREALRYRNDQTVFLIFGTIRPYKGIEILLDAWQRVICKCKDALLVIAGTGDPAYIQVIISKIAALALSDSVHQNFKFIPDNELPVYIQAADVLVYPYKDVTQSGALLTGMAFGKPIVASALGAFKETLRNGKAGILVEPDNVKELANALIMLIKSPQERARLGAAALEELNNKYSWDAIADKTIQCYSWVSVH